MRSAIADIELARIRARLNMPPREAVWWGGLGRGDRRMLAIAAGNEAIADLSWDRLSPERRVSLLAARKRAADWASEIDPYADADAPTA